MTKESNIKIFEGKQVRSVWDDETEEWYFAVVDVVEVLTDSTNPTDYLKKMRKRDPELGLYIGTNCPQVAMLTSTGKNRKTLAGTPEHIFRIIQSIPSKKAEPFKVWMAQVAAERLDEIADPEKAILRGADYYRAKGYTEGWIIDDSLYHEVYPEPSLAQRQILRPCSAQAGMLVKTVGCLRLT